LQGGLADLRRGLRVPRVRLKTRAYGESGASVIVLHGGPGAAGEMAPVARGLAGSFRVLEPFQRAGTTGPLTVADHVADLRDLIWCHSGERPVAIVGFSWGAMLALAFAAAHPDLAGPLVLIGCGSFDTACRARFRAIVDGRTSDSLRLRLERLAAEIPNPDERFRTRASLIRPLYSHCLISGDEEPLECDARAHDETWADMMRLQEEGIYPAAFTAIPSPVLMLHGAVDPHPGRMIWTSLRPYLPQIEYHEWALCGHYPWLEKEVRNEFFAFTKTWLSARLAEPSFGVAQ
jgi:pimeloyl-ACP methyl ester carboxylesterase